MTKKSSSSSKRPRWQSLVGTGIALLVVVFIYLQTGQVPEGALDAVLGTDAATLEAILQPSATPEPTETPADASTDTPTATAPAAATDTPTAQATATDTPSPEPTSAPSDTPTALPAATDTPTKTPTVTRTASPTPQPSATPTASPTRTRAPPTATPTATRIRSQSGLPFILYKDLPPEAKETIRLIDNNGPFPFRQDDTTFQNREGILPAKPRGWYREFTVVTPGASTRGARRIVEGEDGLLFYTDDHYDSFREVIR